MDIGQLYDRTIADHYDQDTRGLISSGRETAFRQLEQQLNAAEVASVLDLAAGTGSALVAVRERFPDAALHGIDLSEKMLAIARQKLAFNAIHDDVANAGRHLPASSVDLMLMHYLTTFIDGARVVAETAPLLRPGGHFSIVSSTFDAFPHIHALALRLLPAEFIREANPAPRDAEEVAGYMRGAGLEVVAHEVLIKPVSFDNFDDFYAFGMNSGFFTHILARLSEEQVAAFAQMTGLFPLHDTYRAAVVLARKPA